MSYFCFFMSIICSPMRRLRGAASCCVPIGKIISIAVLMVSVGMITVQGYSQLNDEEIEFYLNRVNKPAVKTVMMEDGDVIDCVDIYKQPAFDHPQLKDHKIITMPSFVPKTGKIANASLQRLVFHPILQNGEECPQGTIPIRRTQKSDLIRAKSLDGYGRRDAVPAYEMVERAGLVGLGGYVGATGSLNVWPVHVENNEWSHADVELSDETQKSFIEGGWLVNPELYGDNGTRLYAYWTADGYGNTGCYNLLCPGFVQTSQKVVLGAAVSPLSVYDGDQYEIIITIMKDEVKNAWWLVIEGEPVGYWPVSIFVNNFADARTIKWLGGVLNTNNGGRHTTTAMGSGHFPSEGFEKAAFIRNMQVMRSSKEGFDFPDPSTCSAFADKPKCYDVQWYGTYMYYGGPGLGADGC